MRKIYDCFLFHNEFDILELKLKILADVIDYFVICESSMTHSGQPKPYYFEESKDRFKEFEHKIIHLKVDNTPVDFVNLPCSEDRALNEVYNFCRATKMFDKRTTPYYAREFFQRESIRRALVNCDDKDVILLTDCDEIANPDIIRSIATLFKDNEATVYILRMRSYYYYLNLLKEMNWDGVKMFTYDKVRKGSLNELRYVSNCVVLQNAGWHFSFQGNVSKVREKITSYSHHTMGTEEVLTLLPDRIKKFEDPYGRGMLRRVEIDKSFPAYLVENRTAYEHLILDINLLESTVISNLCDYSFGDHAMIIHRLQNSFMNRANSSNDEFLALCEQFKSSGRNTMTLFIDNVRLYKRPGETFTDARILSSLMEKENLLELCASLPYMNFIIFTGHDDTPIDDFINSFVPQNVLEIHAVNAITYGGKVRPFFYGLQRRLNPRDNRKELMQRMVYETRGARNLLYVNHSVGTNARARTGIFELFENMSWARVDRNRIEYSLYLNRIKDHKFMICPIGNAIDCHRNYEVLYLRRVPIMIKNDYLEHLYRDFPVLFVQSFSEVTAGLLMEYDNLYQQALSFDMDLLDAKKVFKQRISFVDNTN